MKAPQTKQALIKKLTDIQKELNISLMDAIIHFSETYGMEIEALAEQIRKSHKIKEELRQEAIGLRMVLPKDE